MTKPKSKPKRIKARPTVYKGIQMRSRLEAGFAAWLDQDHFTWEYEPYALANEEGQYLPDFVLTDVFAAWAPGLVKVVVEVKPNTFDVVGCTDEDDWITIRQQALLVHNEEPATLMVVAQPCGFSLVNLQMTPQEKAERAAKNYAADPGREAREAAVMAELCPDYDPSISYWHDFEAVRLDLIQLPDDRIGFALPAATRPWLGEYWKPAQ